MQCTEISERLSAWVDDELPRPEAERINKHLKQCPGCRLEALNLQRIVASLESIQAIHAPATLSKKILHSFRVDFEKQGIMKWWDGLSLALRGVVLGAVLAGLICGALMSASIASPNADQQTDPYQSLYASKGIFP